MESIQIINDASFGLRRAVAKALVAHGLDVTTEEWAALATLQAIPGMTMTELATRADRDKTTMTRMVDRLVAKGLAERRDNPKDRRVARLFLSRVGYETWEALQKPVADAIAQSIDGIDHSEIDVMQSVLGRMVQNLRGGNGDSQPIG